MSQNQDLKRIQSEIASFKDEDLMLMYALKKESDHPLVLERAQAAFAELYDRYAQRIEKYLSIKLRNPESVHDVFQNTFNKLHKSKNQYDGRVAFQAWIFTISRSCVLDFLRKKKTDEVHLEEISTEASMAPTKIASPVQSEPLHVELEAFMTHLSPREREVIELRIYDEQTFAEIAEQLDISEKNARKILSRGLQNLRQLFSTRIKS